jgi:hypothetical protein
MFNVMGIQERDYYLMQPELRSALPAALRSKHRAYAYQNDGRTSVKSNKDEAVITYLQHFSGLRVVQGSDGSGDQTEHDEELSNIQRVKNLLINGPAFENFRVLLEFILAGKESPPVTDNPASTSAANSDQSQSAGDDANAAIKFGPKKLPCIQPLEAISHGTHQEGRNDPSCARPVSPR